MKVKRPLPKGTKISWCDMISTVVEDIERHNYIMVRGDGCDFTNEWQWVSKGIECKVISYPPKVKNRYYVMRNELCEIFETVIEWLVCDRNIKTTANVICRATTRKNAYDISKLLNEKNSK